MSAAYPTAPAVAFVSSLPLALTNVWRALLVGGALTPSPTAVTGSTLAYPHATKFQFDGLQLAFLSPNEVAQDDPRNN